MFENLSIGDFAAAALGTGADAVMKGAGGQELEDAYNAVKEHVCLRCPKEMASLEQMPHSVARRGIVAFIMDHRPDEYKSKLQALVETLIDLIKMEGPSCGVDINYLLLLETHFYKPKVVEASPGEKAAKVKKSSRSVKAAKSSASPSL